MPHRLGVPAPPRRVVAAVFCRTMRAVAAAAAAALSSDGVIFSLRFLSRLALAAARFSAAAPMPPARAAASF